MIRVFRDAGYETTRHVEYGEVTLEFAIDETAMTEAVMREREQRAEARSIQRLLLPPRSRWSAPATTQGKIGNAVFGNLLRMGFNGPLYPVNPDARHVGGVRAYPSVLDVPDDVDLVGDRGAGGVGAGGGRRQCAARGVRGLVVISGGFGERGDDDERAHGLQAQRDLVAAGARARHAGGRPELPGRGQHRPDVVASTPRWRRCRRCPGGPGSSASPARSASRCSARRPGAGWASRRSSRPATGPTCRATTCCSTGRPTTPPTSCCCTWRASATRASSPGWPAGSAGPSRSSR